MTLSIIVPVYNTEDYVLRCLKSIEFQKHDDVEVVIIDDGSTDQSGKICDEFSKNFRNTHVLHKENGGLSSARNCGIRNSKGEYLCFLDSDDMLAEGFCDDILKFLKDHRPDVIGYKDCREKQENIYTISGNRKIEILNSEQYLNQLISNKIGNQICFRVFKRELFNGIEFPEKRYYEDIFTFWKLIIRAKKIVDVNYTYYIYNLTNENSITKKVNLAAMKDMKEAIDEMCSGLSEHTQEYEFDKEKIEYALLNIYIYIAYKIRNSSDETMVMLKKEIDNKIRTTKVNLLKYKDYDWKKYMVYKLFFLNK